MANKESLHNKSSFFILKLIILKYLTDYISFLLAFMLQDGDYCILLVMH